MKKYLTVLACICTVVNISAMEWPATEFKPLRFFGQRSEGVIERGLTLEKTGPVRAAGHASVLITLAQNRNMSGFPGTLGNAVMLAHDDGLVSIYGNLDSIDLLSERIQVDSLSMIGSPGKSGWGNEHDFMFQIVDAEKKIMLNPLLLLSALKDTHGPLIKDAVMVSQNNQLLALGSTKNIRQGTYKLYADISDTVDSSSNQLSPFRVSVLLNGSEYATIPFELLKAKSGQLYLSSSDYTWENLYKDSSRLYLGEIKLTRGRSDISIIARDFAGNERSVVFGLQIE